jgi:putative protease
MAARQKAKGKAKTLVRKTKATRKKPTKKAPVRRASAGKARPAAKGARKPAPARARAKSKAAKPSPGVPARPAPAGERIGLVTHYFGEPSVAILQLERGTLRVGDVIHFHGHTTDFRQTVGSLQVDHAPVTEVGPKDDFGLKVTKRVREHDVVYKVRP